jgi:hypothetical protein
MTRMRPMLVWLYLTVSVAAQDRVAGLLPRDARIIETANVQARSGKGRTLALWMDKPRRVTSAWDSAADFLYGDHWFGPTFLSLIDPSNDRLINTVKVRPREMQEDGDGFAVPFFRYDGPYYVPHANKDRKGTPLLLRLRDLTGEGVAGQFVLFDHVALGIAAGSVFGYNAKSDIAVQYLVETTQNRFKPVIKPWAVGVFGAKPLRAGSWKFTWEAGYGSSAWIDEEVHFDPATQLFVEKVTTRPYPGFGQVHCDLDRTSLADFLGHMQKVASDEAGFKWLEDLISGTASNGIEATGMVPTFRGRTELLDLDFQSTGDGTIDIEFTADSDFAAALQAEFGAWCRTN